MDRSKVSIKYFSPSLYSRSFLKSFVLDDFATGKSDFLLPRKFVNENVLFKAQSRRLHLFRATVRVLHRIVYQADPVTDTNRIGRETPIDQAIEQATMADIS